MRAVARLNGDSLSGQNYCASCGRPGKIWILRRSWRSAAKRRAVAKAIPQTGISGIERDAPRPGRSQTLNADETVRRTTQDKPAHGLKPDRVGTFTVSNDPQFAEKL